MRESRQLSAELFLTIAVFGGLCLILAILGAIVETIADWWLY